MKVDKEIINRRRVAKTRLSLINDVNCFESHVEGLIT